MVPYAVSLVALNFFSCLLLGLVLYRLLHSFKRIDRPLWLFLSMVSWTMVLLVVDSVFWLADGIPGLAWLNWAANILYFIVQPVVPCLWLLYVSEYIPGFPGRFGHRLIAAGMPVLVFAGLVAATPWTGWLFTIGTDGVYHRGELFWLAVVIAYFFLVSGFGLGLVFRRRIPYRVLQPLLGFGVLPGLAAAAQSLVYGIAVIWPAIALSLLVIYLWVEGEMLALDYLTGLQNRRNLHRFLEHRLKEAKAGRGVGGLMIDVDDFKKINDTWGHQAGDEALRTLAQCLRSCFHHQDFIARYGGDEFVAILNVETAAELEAAVHRFRSLLRENRRVRATPWELGVSVGAGMFDPAQAGAADPVDRFLAQLDRAMYQDKAFKAQRS